MTLWNLASRFLPYICSPPELERGRPAWRVAPPADSEKQAGPPSQGRQPPRESGPCWDPLWLSWPEVPGVVRRPTSLLLWRLGQSLPHPQELGPSRTQRPAYPRPGFRDGSGAQVPGPQVEKAGELLIVWVSVCSSLKWAWPSWPLRPRLSRGLNASLGHWHPDAQVALQAREGDPLSPKALPFAPQAGWPTGALCLPCVALRGSSPARTVGEGVSSCEHLGLPFPSGSLGLPHTLFPLRSTPLTPTC